MGISFWMLILGHASLDIALHNIQAFVGAIEELIFRSILLTRLEKVLEPGAALLISAILFGIMHSAMGASMRSCSPGFSALL
jgi:membrane protease YdiL (CAAX protease family)